jgi:hypothetical protein
MPEPNAVGMTDWAPPDFNPVKTTWLQHVHHHHDMPEPNAVGMTDWATPDFNPV